MGQRIRIEWEGDFSGTSSLGQVNIELARRLVDRLELSIRPPAGSGAVPPYLQPYVGRNVAPSDVHVRHGASRVTDAPAEGAWVWMQPWEMGAALPWDWLDVMRHRVDAVCVYSAWVREHLVRAGVPGDRVMHIPLGVDTVRFHPSARPLPLPTSKRFRFLYVGGLSLRKGNDLLLRAYRTAFTAADDVALVLKTFANEGRYDAPGLLGFEADFAEPDAPELVVMPQFIAEEDLPGLYTACDVYAHPYRGEGFCLPLAEAMASGLPVITTDRGGASSFCTAATARLLSSQPVYLPRFAISGREVSNFPHWQEPHFGELVSAMRSVYENPAPSRAAALRGRAGLVETHSWDRAADAMLDSLERASARARPPRRYLTPVRSPQVTYASVATGEPGDVHQALRAARTEWVCLLEAGDRLDPSFTGAVDRWIAHAHAHRPAAAIRLVHHAAGNALPPLERFVTRLIRADQDVRFSSEDADTLLGADGRPLAVDLLPQLIVHREDEEHRAGRAAIAADVARALAHHRAGNAAAALAVLGDAWARHGGQPEQPPLHRGFLVSAYVTLAVALGAYQRAARVAADGAALGDGQPLYLTARGHALLALGDLAAAAACFHRAIGIERLDRRDDRGYAGTLVEAITGLGRVAESQGLLENAFRFQCAALACMPRDTEIARAGVS